MGWTCLVIWPERRYVNAYQIKLWYSDAVANGEDVPHGLTSPWEMAKALHALGTITLGKDR